MTLLLVVAAGVAAFLTTSAVTWAARRASIMRAPHETKMPRLQRGGRIPVTTRMALQVLSALALAFAIGMPLFRVH